jgi:hypothetical protein
MSEHPRWRGAHRGCDRCRGRGRGAAAAVPMRDTRWRAPVPPLLVVHGVPPGSMGLPTYASLCLAHGVSHHHARCDKLLAHYWHAMGEGGGISRGSGCPRTTPTRGVTYRTRRTARRSSPIPRCGVFATQLTAPRAEERPDRTAGECEAIAAETDDRVGLLPATRPMLRPRSGACSRDAQVIFIM